LALFGRRPPYRVDRPASRRPKTCTQSDSCAAAKPSCRLRESWWGESLQAGASDSFGQTNSRLRDYEITVMVHSIRKAENLRNGPGRKTTECTVMSGRRSLSRDSLTCWLGSWVRSCLRPLSADRGPLALMLSADPSPSITVSRFEAQTVQRASGINPLSFASPLGHPQLLLAKLLLRPVRPSALRALGRDLNPAR
jgi:hypothetical protein